jgi:Restriction alleviation protein Lar
MKIEKLKKTGTSQFPSLHIHEKVERCEHKINELIDAFDQFKKDQDLLINSVMHSKKEKELEIRPCPFCGHNATIKEQNIVKIPYYKITCENKYCSSLNYMSKKEEAIKFWNKRYT